MYPSVLPQSPTLPAITYEQSGGERLSGLTADTGLAIGEYTITAWGATHASARAVAEQVRLALQRYQNDAADPPVLDGILQEEQSGLERDTRNWRTQQWWDIWYREAPA